LKELDDPVKDVPFDWRILLPAFKRVRSVLNSKEQGLHEVAGFLRKDYYAPRT
jgi:hypothetical protein